MSAMVQKVWADLWGNKGRTLQVTLIIAMSAFGVGLVIGGKNLTSQAITNDWLQGNPPAIKINVNPSMDEDQLFALKHIDGINEVEGFQTATIEWRHNPDEPWRNAVLNARDDYLNQKIARQALLDGQWPTRKVFAMENGFESTDDLSIGDVIQVRIDDQEYDVEIGGTLNAFDIAPAFADDLVLYTTRSRFADLTGREDYNVIAAKDLSFDWQRAQAADAELKDRLDKLEIESTGAIPPFLDRVAEPERHFAQNILDASFTLLGVIGGLIVILGMFLVFNSVSAIIVQQVSQIGVMKAIGARTGQILQVYLLLVITYGVLAAIISVPLAAMAAHGIRLFFSSQTGVLGRSFALDSTAVIVQILVALLAPLLASLGPILSGARITVREAISTYGLGGASGLIERFVTSAQLLPYTLLLTIANTFRNKPRLAFTQISLVGSGIIFITVLGVRDSTSYTFGTELTSIHQYQVTLEFEEDERISRIAPMTLAQPGVAALEMWNVEKATVRPAMQREYTVDDRQTLLFGLPSDSQMYTPKITMGRWLLPEDERAVVLHEELAAKVGVGVGDWVTFRYRAGKESNWQVVGLLFDPAKDNLVMMSQPALAQALSQTNRANTLWIQTTETDAKTTERMAPELARYFEEKNVGISLDTVFNAQTVTGIGERRLRAYGVIVGLLSIMALVIAGIGGMGLSGMLSLSVLERTREIGVMRAIGAASSTITRLFIGEGLIQALLSWLIALPMGIALAYLMSTRVISTILDDQLVYQFTLRGPLLWLVLVSMLAVLASWFPARKATKISVRESLVYR